MDKRDDIFSPEYPIEPTTEASGKLTEEKEKDETVAQTIRYDTSKPYRVIIRAKESK